MWGAYEEDGGSTHTGFSRSHVLQPKVWTETVDRLLRLRRQHWQEPSELIPPHHRHHHHHPHPQQQHHRPHPQQHHSHPQQHQHHPHPHPQQHQHHPHPQPQHQHHHHQHYQHQLCHQQQHHQQQHHHQQPHHQHHPSHPSLRSYSNSKLPRHGHGSYSTIIIHNQGNQSFTSQSQGSKCTSTYDPNPNQNTSLLSPIVAQLGTSSYQTAYPDHKERNGFAANQTKIPFLPSSAIWREEVVPVPSGLVKETDSKSLKDLVNNGVESYLHHLRRPTSNVCKDFKPLKPSHVISAGSLYHFRPPNLGQRDREDWMRKHRRKKTSKSSYNVAFGRSNSAGYSRRRNGTDSANNAETKNATNSGSFLRCLRGKLNARREVLKAIQDYHINAEARAQLEKRASEFEREKKEKQRKKAASHREAVSKRKSRQFSVVLQPSPR